MKIPGHATDTHALRRTLHDRDSSWYYFDTIRNGFVKSCSKSRERK